MKGRQNCKGIKNFEEYVNKRSLTFLLLMKAIKEKVFCYEIRNSLCQRKIKKAMKI